MKNTNDFVLLDKSTLKELTLKDISIPLPDLKNIFDSKATVIANWLIDWIETDFKSNQIKVNDLLPKKAEFAYHLGVSIGTMQNAFRIIEDKGYVESKQCLGTMVRDWQNASTSLRKLTSKRDVSINSLKKYIIDNKIKIGQSLPSSRQLAIIIGASTNTTRLAMENLCSVGIVEHKFKSSNDSNWILKSNDFSVSKSKSGEAANETLVEQIEKDIENYITKNLKVGDKMPAHENLSKELKVSVKTIHDALKALIKNGVLLALRGRYGTTVIKMPNESDFSPRKETSIFASAQETAFYNYEKTQNHIKTLIAQKYEIGSKLPSIIQLSKELDLSPNTIRKAFNNLSDEGYLRFERGRYGGTFVIDIPETSSHAFKWLAVSPKYVQVYN
jgi:DNA-binding GntR family transcriptional regulator